MTIEAFASRSYLLPLIAEACIVTLARVNEHSKATRFNDQAKVEKFIYRYKHLIISYNITINYL